MKKKEEKDRAIIQAARNAFLQAGVAGARMDMIAKEACVSKATLYKYYPSKDELFSHLIHQMFDQMSKEMQYSYTKGASVDSMLQNILTRKFELVREPVFMDLIRILSVEFIKKYNFDAETIKYVSEGHSHFIFWVEQCQQDGKILKKHSAEDISLWFHSLLDGMIFWPLVMNLKKVPTEEEQNHYRHIISQSFLKMFVSAD